MRSFHERFPGRIKRFFPLLVSLVFITVLAGGTYLVTLRPKEPPADENDSRGSVATQETPSTPHRNVRVINGRMVRLKRGDNFQRKVGNNPPGTHFVVASGIHRMQRVLPKDGMTFTGEKGAVMSGARVLRSFDRDGSLWVATGQSQQGFVHPGGANNTVSGYERDNYPEDLFIDGTRLRHVSSKSQVGPGKWFFDYGADKIYIGNDPAGKLVETSVTDYAFYGPDVKDVVIENLTIRHYASPSQQGAIHARSTRNWTIRRVDASHNHAVGIHTGFGTHLHHSRMAHNGQMGLRSWGQNADGTTYGAPAVIEHNEIARNRELGYAWGWEGGAMKILRSKGMVFRNNWVHHNNGPGIWFDSNNRDITIASNLVEHNSYAGIFYEISYGDTKIYWNTVRHNGNGNVGPATAGIYISNSRDIEVFGNAVDSNNYGILLRMVDRHRGPDGRLETANVKVRNNDIRMFTGHSGLSEETGDDAFFTSKGNVFEDNTYRLDDPDARRFDWVRGWEANDWDEWRDFGHDESGQLLSDDPAIPALPGDAVVFSIQQYGPHE